MEKKEGNREGVGEKKREKEKEGGKERRKERREEREKHCPSWFICVFHSKPCVLGTEIKHHIRGTEKRRGK